MNTLLKAMLKEVVDLVAIGKEALAKDWGKVVSALLQAGQDVPAIVENFGDLKVELEKLVTDPTADADLLAYVVGLVGGQDDKAKAVITASVDLVLTSVVKVTALVHAIQLPAAVAPAALEVKAEEVKAVEEVKVEEVKPEEVKA